MIKKSTQGNAIPILYFSQKIREMTEKLQYNTKKTVLLIGGQSTDESTSIGVIHGVIKWIARQKIVLDELGTPGCLSNDKTQSQILRINFKDFTFTIIVKEIQFGRIVGLTVNDFENYSQSQKQDFALFFDIVIKSFGERSSQIKVYTPIFLSRPNDRAIRNQLSSLSKFIKVSEDIHVQPIIFGANETQIKNFQNNSSDYKNTKFIGVTEQLSKINTQQFFKDCYQAGNIKGNLIQTYKQQFREFTINLRNYTNDSQNIIQMLYIIHQQIILAVQPLKIDQSTSEIKTKVDQFLLQSSITFEQLQKHIPVSIQQFPKSEIKHYIKDRVFQNFKNEDDCLIKSTTQVPPKLAPYLFLSEIKKINTWFTNYSLNGIQKVIQAVKRIITYFQYLCSLDTILLDSDICEELKPRNLGQILSLARQIINGLLIFKQFTGISLTIANHFYPLLERNTPNSKAILTKILGTPLQKNESEHYYDVVITIVTDLLKSCNLNKKEGNEFNKACNKFISTAIFYKVQKILHSYLDTNEKLIEGIKLLIQIYQKSMVQGKNQDINQTTVLNAAGFMLRIVGLSNLCKYIYKKQKKPQQYLECLYEQAMIFDLEQDKCSFFFGHAKQFTQWGFPQKSKELYQYVFENSNDSKLRVLSKLQILQIANSQVKIHHNEMFHLEKMKQKNSLNTNPEDSFYDKILYEYEEETIDEQFFQQIEKLKYDPERQIKKLNEQKIAELRQRLLNELST